MEKVTLYIETYDGAKTVTLDEELSIGRTDAANIVLGDAGLSRVNTTFFRDEDLVFVVDENSTNGTFVNGESVSGQPRQIFNGDRIKIGTETRIRVEIGQPSSVRQPPSVTDNNLSQAANSGQQTTGMPPQPNPKPAIPNPQSNASSPPPMLLFAAVGSTLLIAFFGIAAYLVVSRYEISASNSTANQRRRELPLPPRFRFASLTRSAAANWKIWTN
jgi:pSer/pThr/pTyr-binding forkhead associated (FHA) protein